MNGVCLEETAGSRSFIEKTRGIKAKGRAWTITIDDLDP